MAEVGRQNHDGEIDPDEIVLHREGPAPNGITMHGDRPVADYVSYTSLGHARLAFELKRRILH